MLAALFASITPRVPTSAVSFCRLMKSFSSGGMMLRTACGRITYRIEDDCVRPSERAAATWLQVLRRQLGQRAIALQRGQRLVHAGHQRVALGEQQAAPARSRELLSRTGGRVPPRQGQPRWVLGQDRCGMDPFDGY